MTFTVIGDRPEQLLVILIVEALFGYPAALHRIIPHPVVWIGTLITRMDRAWNKGGAQPKSAIAAGIAVVAVLIGLMIIIGMALQAVLTGSLGAALLILIATTGLAQRSLYDHVRKILVPLEQGDITGARRALAMIVGRDTADLDDREIASAATESLAESFCDGIVAPAFWFLLAGLPGLFVYKAINTADSLIGHKDDRYRYFGWAAARVDDVMNYIPARIAGLLICLAGMGGWRIMVRDAPKHLSPNAGWSEAAMAGVLKVQMGGGAAYDGEWIARAPLGDGARPGPAELKTGLAVYLRACLLLWALVGALIWAL
ncbi:adenosylcobinamide-phosphate synthase CbiB [Parasphingorhabdus sp. JC815]|uniref:adenosylcobinamide-phosphate synthase CbiB n=1 Tax=Parasphingorhabdus sp. JC815 TaxID=3232140 RepID=UPI0034581E7F